MGTAGATEIFIGTGGGGGGAVPYWIGIRQTDNAPILGSLNIHE
jgi:hypothetical protein